MKLHVLMLIVLMVLAGCATPAEMTPIKRKSTPEVRLELNALNGVALGSDGKLYMRGDWLEASGDLSVRTAKTKLTERQTKELPEEARRLLETTDGLEIRMDSWKLVADHVVDVAIPGPVCYLTDNGDLYTIHDDFYRTPGQPVLLAHHVAALCRTSPESFITEAGDWIIVDSFGIYVGYEGAEAFTGVSGHSLVKLASDVRDASGSNRSFAYVNTSGQLFVSGYNDFGTLGNGRYDAVLEQNYIARENAGMPIEPDDYSPTRFYSVLDGVKQVYLFYKNVFAIRTDGSLWGWGANEYGTAGVGKHGDGDVNTRDVVAKPTKILDHVVKMDYVFPLLDMTTAQNGFLALTEKGQLYSWGSNYHGNLANGQVGYPRESLFDEGCFADRPQLILSDVQDYSRVMHAYGTAFFALRTNGDVYAWGNNAGGFVGTGEHTDSARRLTAREPAYMVLTPTKILEDIVCLTDFTSTGAVRKDGAVLCWGYNPFDWEIDASSAVVLGDAADIDTCIFNAILLPPTVNPYISAIVGEDGSVSFVPAPVE